MLVCKLHNCRELVFKNICDINLSQTNLVPLLMIGLTIGTKVHSDEIAMKCAYEPPIKYVDNLLLNDQVYARIDGAWAPFCNGSNERLKVKDRSVVCTKSEEFFIGEPLKFAEATYKKCNGLVPSGSTLHTGYESDSMSQNICVRGKKNIYNIFDEKYITVKKSVDNYWVTQTIYDFELGKQLNKIIGPTTALESKQFAVVTLGYPSSSYYYDVYGYRWYTRGMFVASTQSNGYDCEIITLN